MVINHNLKSMNAHRNMATNTEKSSKSMEKLSSGLRINRAGDDAAGLTISEGMRGQIRGLDQAARNSQDGISMIQTAEGGLSEAHSILQRMRELAVQGSNDTNVSADRNAINTELDQLNLEIEKIKDGTSFNSKNLLDSTAGYDYIQVGADANQTMELDFAIPGIDLTDTWWKTQSPNPINVSTTATAQTSITAINAEIVNVSKGRSTLGAWQNTLEHAISNLSNSSENLQAAESRIRDVDMAKAMMDFSKNNILNQSAQAMLAQANQAPQEILQLLR